MSVRFNSGDIGIPVDEEAVGVADEVFCLSWHGGAHFYYNWVIIHRFGGVLFMPPRKINFLNFFRRGKGLNKSSFIQDLCINMNNHQNAIFHQITNFLKTPLALLGVDLKNFQFNKICHFANHSYLCKGLILHRVQLFSRFFKNSLKAMLFSKTIIFLRLKSWVLYTFLAFMLTLSSHSFIKHIENIFMFLVSIFWIVHFKTFIS